MLYIKQIKVINSSCNHCIFSILFATVSIYRCVVFGASAAESATHNEVKMKENIHPEYKEVNVRCSCGNTFKIRTTAGHDLNLDVCSKCHPFFTGKQKIVDTGGRVEAFKKRFGGISAFAVKH